MTILREAGLKTPESWLVRTDELLPLRLDADQIYYCRASINGTKTTVPAAGTDLARALPEHAGLDVEWLIQPLYDFPFGGAAYADPTCTYVELALGSTIGLLRHGELSYAWYRGETASWSHSSAQETQWTYKGSGLTPSAVTAPIMATNARSVCETVAAELRATKLAGLFEWAKLGSVNYYLDLKPPAATGALSMYVHDHLEPRPAEVGAAAFDTPVLKEVTETPATTPVVFRRGARLSHAVTYRCAQGQTRTYFLAW